MKNKLISDCVILKFIEFSRFLDCAVILWCNSTLSRLQARSTHIGLPLFIRISLKKRFSWKVIYFMDLVLSQNCVHILYDVMLQRFWKTEPFWIVKELKRDTQIFIQCWLRIASHLLTLRHQKWFFTNYWFKKKHDDEIEYDKTVQETFIEPYRRSFMCRNDVTGPGNLSNVKTSQIQFWSRRHVTN